MMTEFEQGICAALETYSNVHRGSGHNSMITTRLYEEARNIVRDYLGKGKGKTEVIFCTPRRAEILKGQLRPGTCQCLSSQDFGLPLGVRALVVERKALPAGTPFQTGGGTTRLVGPGWVVWAGPPERFEAGTPAIINTIAFAKALIMSGKHGKNLFQDKPAGEMRATGILYDDDLAGYAGQRLLGELLKTRIGLNVMVPTTKGTKRYINLDNGASTQTFGPIWDTVCKVWVQPHEVQKEIVRETKSICSEILEAPLSDYEVIFTSNTTEAINLAAESLSNEYSADSEPVVLNTILEHNSNDLPWRSVPGCTLVRMEVDDEGFLDMKQLEEILCAYNLRGQYGKKRIRIVAVTGASNVLGVFNDLKEIGRIVHKYDARLLVDAAQMVAHRKVGTMQNGIDYLTFSAHKVYAPFGCGVLVTRKGMLKFSPPEREKIESSGEENTIGIAALGKALILLQRIGLDLIREEEQALTGYLLRNLATVPGLTVHGVRTPDSPRFSAKGGVVVFDMKGLYGDRIARMLSEQGGIGIRFGCHCAHLMIKRLVRFPRSLDKVQALIAMLFPGIRFPGLARVSLGIANNEEDIDTLIRVLNEMTRKPENNIQPQMEEIVSEAIRRVYGYSDRTSTLA